MVTKLGAAEMTLECGSLMALINGGNPNNLYDLFDGKEIGTLFVPENGGKS